MIIIAGYYSVPDEAARDLLVGAHRDLVSRSRTADGCLDVAITADALEPRRVNIFEIWRDAAALDAWRAVANAPDLDVEMQDVAIQRYDATDGGPLFP